jgi:hypothetical protein
MPPQKDPQDPIVELRTAVHGVEDRLVSVQDQLDGLRPALAGLAGLDNVSAGLAQIVEVLAPLRDLSNGPAPPPPNVEAAIERVERAIGPELKVRGVEVSDEQIRYIGEAL